MSRDLETLRMPEHLVSAGDVQEADFYVGGEDEGYVCRSTKVGGYALMQPDGRLHCNRCGWVTPEPVITTYSPDTGNTYLTWDDLVAAEANGWVVVGASDRPGTVPMVVGPYDSQEEARKARSRMRPRWVRDEKREHGDGFKISTYVRVLWKEHR